ncbi:MAG: ZIP family metal transporter [Saprospiraceae bacterium]|nr:ZIP family metal transporter [Saprospiraceae bacterium]
MSALEYSILFLAVILGGGIAVLSPNYQKNQVSIILSFAAAYLLGIIATHLLPGVFFAATTYHAGLFLLGGFLIQLLLENLSQGIEHGHFHKEKTHGSQFYAILLGLCLHALMEGLPLSGYQELNAQGHHHHTDFNHFLAGIAIHHIPAAYVLALLMRTHQFPKGRFWLFLLVFAIMTPLGAWIGEHLLLDMDMVRNMMALVIGSLLHIATTILFETEQGHYHKVSIWKLIAIMTGIGLSLISM